MCCYVLCLRACYEQFAKAAAEAKKAAKQADKLERATLEAAAKKKAKEQRVATDTIDLLKDALPEFNEYVSKLENSDEYKKKVCTLLLDRAKEMMTKATAFTLDPSTKFEGEMKHVRQVVTEMGTRMRTCDCS